MRVKDARQTFLGIWIRSLIEGKPIKVFGDGHQLRDFNYVDDCVDALLMAGLDEKSDGMVFNLGSEEVIELTDLAKMLVTIAGTGSYDLVPFPADRKNIDIGDYYGDFRLITQQLGWRPKVDLRTGLALTLEYYQLNAAQYWDSEP
jgi:dTDP-glucose 4,6-dehydratase/UDP-glucose 4-epimerase